MDLRSLAPAFHMATPANPSTMSPAFRTSSPAPAVCSECRWQLLYHDNGTCIWLWKTFLLQAESVDDHPWRELSTAAMQEVVQISSTVFATIFSPTPLHVHAPFEADALDISRSPFTVDAPSSGGSNNFDGFHEQSDIQLLPTSREPTKKLKKFRKGGTS